MMLPLRILPFYLLLFVACQGQSTNGSERANAANSMDTPTHAFTNRLVDETSPYLLQHAHNPVNWYPWGDEALDKAKAENKLLLISIGYSACHWCHVMEHESFEDTAVAAFMNEHFVCIKVDREERPDIDQIYMDAVQLLTQRGGWPLNCFALPDGKPFFGGTYFPKKQWLNVLDKVQEEYAQNPDKVTEYAERLTEGVQSTDLIAMNPEPPKFTWDGLQEAVRTWSENFDQEEGGPNRAPKFPLPNNYQFLLRYAHLTGDAALMDHVNLTLKKIAYGGIYDQVGGGFARYSTDELWKVPHFEKMLYDNGQLVSLYAEAYQATGDERYKRVVYETLAFVARELTADVGAFYSALDADSEGEEGKFYIWSKAELEELLGSDYALVADYYNINQKGFWEHGNYILLRDRDDAAIAAEHELTTEALTERIERAKATLLEARAKRVRPGLDDKSLTSWNAIMLKGYVDAYQVFREPRFLEAALRNARFLTEVQRREDGGLWHSYKEGRSTLNGYLEDYAFTIEALIGLYEATFDEQWLNHARALADYSIAHFHNPSNRFFYFTSDLDRALVARKTELNDNVIPASNSSMANGLFLLGHYYDHQPYLEQAEAMLNNIREGFARYPSGYSNWMNLMLRYLDEFYEIAITGPDALEKLAELNQHYLPNKLLLGSTGDSQLPLLEHKFTPGETRIYVCLEKVCQRPVEAVSEALAQTKK